jgi:AraC-like DNA-binding protein
LHVHDAYEITLILSDGVTVYANDESYTVPFGSLLIFNTMDSHRVEYNGNEIYRRFVLQFKPEFLSKQTTLSPKLLRVFFLRNFENPNLLPLTENELSEVLEFYNRLRKIQGKVFMKNERMTFALAEFLVYINELYFTKNDKKLPTNYNEYGAIYKAILYIQENYASDMTRKTLSTITGINERTLCDHFKNVTGMTTNQYILTYRLSVAKSLLLGGMPTAEVSEKTGFDNYSNFSRTFKTHVGLSPKKFAMRYASTVNV